MLPAPLTLCYSLWKIPSFHPPFLLIVWTEALVQAYPWASGAICPQEVLVSSYPEAAFSQGLSVGV